MDLHPAVGLELADWDLVARLGLAALIGMILGLDRELRGHAAGLRTHGLVCFSAAIMTVSALDLWSGLEAVRADPLRIYEAAGAFIGIIGAGLVVFTGGQVHNLTTAANLWLTAVVGIACGAGQWPLVAVASMVGLVMLTVIRIIERKEDARRVGSEDDGKA